MSQNNAPHDETFQISFIITYYNIAPDMLRQCVGSIVALDLSPAEREIVVVDDGSPIDPQPALEEFGDAVRLVRQENLGVAAARNRGLEEAQGTHIQFVDADDCLLKAGYEYCIALARNDRRLDIVTLDYLQGKRPVDSRREATKSACMNGPEYMLRYNLRGIDWAYLFRRSLLGDLRFTQGLVHEDEEFVPLLMLRAKRVVRTTARAYFYRQREDSIVTNRDQAHLQKRRADMQHIIAGLQEKAATLDEPEQSALLRRVHQLSMDHIYNAIVLTGDAQVLEQTIGWLRARGLFPLPDHRYTLKYSLFRLATATRVGRRIMLWILS